MVSSKDAPTAPMAEPVKERKAPTYDPFVPEATQIKAGTTNPAFPSLPIPSPSKYTADILPGVPQGSRETSMPVQPPTKPLPPPTPSESVPAQAPLEAPPAKPVEYTSTPKPASTAVDGKVDLSKVMQVHQCFCSPFGKSKSLGDEECGFDEKVKLTLKRRTLKPIHPISYTGHVSKRDHADQEVDVAGLFVIA